MQNSWPTDHAPPPGGKADAVRIVRLASGLKPFEMTRRLGITVSELNECEIHARWPHSANARRKLQLLAQEKGLDIGIAEDTEHATELRLF